MFIVTKLDSRILNRHPAPSPSAFPYPSSKALGVAGELVRQLRTMTAPEAEGPLRDGGTLPSFIFESQPGDASDSPKLATLTLTTSCIQR